MKTRLRSLVSRVEQWLDRPAWLPAISAAGWALRIASVLIFGGRLSFNDERDYDQIATSLLTPVGFSIDSGRLTAFRAPGQPLFLAGVYALLGHHPLVAELLQATFMTAIPFAVASLARSAGLGRRGANAAATLAALHPGLAFAAASLYPTALTATSLTAGLSLSAVALRGEGKRSAAAAGLLLGLAGAATTTFAPLPVLIAAIAALRKRWSAAVLIAALGMAPALAWGARNAVQLGAFTLATGGGMNLQYGANDEATPRSGNWVTTPLVAGRTELEQDHLRRELALDWIRAHPLRWAALCLGRAAAVFDSVGVPRTQLSHPLLASMVGWALLPFVLGSLVGLFLARREPVAWLVAAALSLVVASSAATLVKPRFRFPCDPALAVFAVSAAARWRGRRAGAATARA